MRSSAGGQWVAIGIKMLVMVIEVWQHNNLAGGGNVAISLP